MATTKAEISSLVQIELGELADSLTQEEINRSIDKALAELGYSLPVTGLQEMWAVSRSKRYSIEILLLNEAPSFKFNKLELQQAFEHLKSMIEYYDQTFLAAQKSMPELFPNLSWTSNPAALFGAYITNGFEYARTGESISGDSAYSTPTKFYPTND
jgi:hypothetical protein